MNEKQTDNYTVISNDVGSRIRIDLADEEPAFKKEDWSENIFLKQTLVHTDTYCYTQ